jgi:excinuclease ABC subunit A
MVDGYEYTSDEEIKLDKNKKHNISAVVDRLVIKDSIQEPPGRIIGAGF